MWETKQLMVAIDFHSIFFFHSMQVNGYQQLFVCEHSSKYIFLCLTKESKLYMFETN